MAAVAASNEGGAAPSDATVAPDIDEDRHLKSLQELGVCRRACKILQIGCRCRRENIRFIVTVSIIPVLVSMILWWVGYVMLYRGGVPPLWIQHAVGMPPLATSPGRVSLGNGVSNWSAWGMHLLPRDSYTWSEVVFGPLSFASSIISPIIAAIPWFGNLVPPYWAAGGVSPLDMLPTAYQGLRYPAHHTLVHQEALEAQLYHALEAEVAYSAFRQGDGSASHNIRSLGRYKSVKRTHLINVARLLIDAQVSEVAPDGPGVSVPITTVSSWLSDTLPVPLAPASVAQEEGWGGAGGSSNPSVTASWGGTRGETAPGWKSALLVDEEGADGRIWYPELSDEVEFPNPNVIFHYYKLAFWGVLRACNWAVVQPARRVLQAYATVASSVWSTYKDAASGVLNGGKRQSHSHTHTTTGSRLPVVPSAWSGFQRSSDRNALHLTAFHNDSVSFGYLWLVAGEGLVGGHGGIIPTSGERRPADASDESVLGTLLDRDLNEWTPVQYAAYNGNARLAVTGVRQCLFAASSEFVASPWIGKGRYANVDNSNSHAAFRYLRGLSPSGGPHVFHMGMESAPEDDAVVKRSRRSTPKMRLPVRSHPRDHRNEWVRYLARVCSNPRGGKGLNAFFVAAIQEKYHVMDALAPFGFSTASDAPISVDAAVPSNGRDGPMERVRITPLRNRSTLAQVVWTDASDVMGHTPAKYAQMAHRPELTRRVAAVAEEVASYSVAVDGDVGAQSMGEGPKKKNKKNKKKRKKKKKKEKKQKAAKQQKQHVDAPTGHGTADASSQGQDHEEGVPFRQRMKRHAEKVPRASQ